VTALRTKMFRDLARMKGQAFAIGLVMACGVATFVMSLGVLNSLLRSLDAYYEQNRFADVFVNLKRAPLSVVDRITAVPGVSHAQARVVEQITLDIPGLREPATGRIVSLSEHAGSGLNLLHLRSGRYPESRGAREVIVSERFASAHSLGPGDRVRAVLNGRRQDLRIVGVALSPEYIYLISLGSILPDKERYGVFWMARDEMGAAFDMDGAFNDLAIAVAPGADVDDVISRVDVIIERYGGLGAHGREDQLSHRFVANEIEEIEGMILVSPLIFLGVSAFLLNIVISRLISTQRVQIAALKALGYSRSEIGLHYLSFVLFISGFAVVMGSALGAWLGHKMTVMYIEFFALPAFEYALEWWMVVLASLICLSAALLGVLHALRGAMLLPPAEAMRPKAPPSFKPTILERIGLERLLPTNVRMIVRKLERQPVKAIFSVLGVAMATSILVVGRFTENAMDYVIDFQFSRVQMFDMDVAFGERTDESAMSSIRSMPGVLSAEAYRGVSVRIRNGHRERRVGIMGLSRSDGMYRMTALDGSPVNLPKGGIVLSKILGEVLGVAPGETVTVEVLEGRRPVFDVLVTGLIDEFSGSTGYMDLDHLNRLLKEQGTIGGVFVQADPDRLDDLIAELHDAPQVAAFGLKSAAVQNIRDTIDRSIGMMRVFLLASATVIAVGVVYNSARISLSEQARDLATMRVLGFTKREVASIYLGELAIIVGCAIPLGLLIGTGLSKLTSDAMGSELFRIPFVIYPSTFGMAGLVVAGASLVSGVVVGRRLDHLDLVSVLKAGET